MSGGQRVTLIIMVIVVGIVATFAFLPLPRQAEGTCGPGTTSSSAVWVKLFPDSAVWGDDISGATEQAAADAFKAHCQGVADARLVEVGVVSFASLLVGAVVLAILDPARRRAPRPVHR